MSTSLKAAEAESDKIRLRPDAFERMAEAAAAAAQKAGVSVQAWWRGKPNARGLLGGDSTGIPNVMFNTPGYAPANVNLGRMGRLHAQRRGISFWEALAELCVAPGEDIDTAEAASSDLSETVAA